ncbi:MAG: sulfotransferase family 2 domain-containing protein [Microcystaceae cyanobacterium]
MLKLPGKLTYKLKSKKERIQEKYFQSFVFIHINKTGGSSIASALGIKQKHLTALEYKSQLGKFQDWLWARKFTFAIVRNPWDRLISQYAYRIKVNKCQMKTNPIEFHDWLKLAYVEKNPQYYDEPNMFIPQLDWLVDEQGEIIVDYIGRFETLETDFHYICEKIGIEAKLPHLNVSPRNKPYQDYYTPQSIKLVGELFKKDIDYFNYTF